MTDEFIGQTFCRIRLTVLTFIRLISEGRFFFENADKKPVPNFSDIFNKKRKAPCGAFLFCCESLCMFRAKSDFLKFAFVSHTSETSVF